MKAGQPEKTNSRIRHHWYQWRGIREFFVFPQDLSQKLRAIRGGAALA